MPVENPQPVHHPFPEGRPPALRNKAFWEPATAPLLRFLKRWRTWSEIQSKMMVDQHSRELYQHGLAYLKLNDLIIYDKPTDSWGPNDGSQSDRPLIPVPVAPPKPKRKPPPGRKKKIVSEA